MYVENITIYTIYTAELIITSGHRTFSVQLCHMSDQIRTWSDKMSGRKRVVDSVSNEGSLSKKRDVTVETVQKWIRDNDKSLNTSTWLQYVKIDRKYVEKLKCSVCVEFVEKFRGMRNYSAAFIDGSKNLRASSFKDHAATKMHKRAMLLYKKQHSSDITEYSPVARALYNLDAESETIIKRKFDIAYFISKENLAFMKMGPLCK